MCGTLCFSFAKVVADGPTTMTPDGPKLQRSMMRPAGSLMTRQAAGGGGIGKSRRVVSEVEILLVLVFFAGKLGATAKNALLISHVAKDISPRTRGVQMDYLHTSCKSSPCITQKRPEELDKVLKVLKNRSNGDKGDEQIPLEQALTC